MKKKGETRPAPDLDLGNVVDLYVRVSTTEQAQEGFSVGEQESRLKAYCSAYGFVINAVHTDPGYSGANLDRPGIKQVIRDVRAGVCKKVIVWKLDRLSRSQKDTLMLLEDVFLANGCDFVSLMESFDTSTPFGRCIVGILAAFAQMERENIKARTMMGKQAGLKAGNYYAPYVPLGYTLERDISGSRVLKVDPFWSQMIKELYSRLAAGEAPRSIAVLFHEKYGFGSDDAHENSLSLLRLAKNPTNCGRVSYGGNIYEGKHEPLVSVELWERVNARLKENTRVYNRMYTGSEGLLTGLIFCGCCGARMALRKWGSGSRAHKRYLCYSAYRSNPKMVKDPNCQNKKSHYTAAELDNLVLGEIRKLSLDRSAFDSVLESSHSENEPNLDAFDERLEALNKQITRLLNLYQAGAVDLEEIQDRLTDLREEREAVSASAEKMRDAAGAPMPPAAAWDSLCNLQAVIDAGDPSDLYALVHSLIRKVEVYNDDITIYWSFC